MRAWTGPKLRSQYAEWVVDSSHRFDMRITQSDILTAVRSTFLIGPKEEHLLYPRNFAVRLSDVDYRRLEVLADDRDCTLSDVIRDLIAAESARHGEGEERGHMTYRESVTAR